MIRLDHVLFTGDGFWMITQSISSLLISRGIDIFPDRDGKILECRYFFDDWFLFAVPDRDSYINPFLFFMLITVYHEFHHGGRVSCIPL